MPINPDLLIAAPMLQDAFVDKDGTPMSGGVVTCYQDNSRTTLKNWYYQSSNFGDVGGNYSFSPLPNPLTLSAAGTICDVNGVDTIPFFYPYSEIDEEQPQPYYITIVNHDQTNQITRPNFPYNREATSPETTAVAVTNLIVNNGFWRNAQPNYINQSPYTSISLSSGGNSSILTSMPLNVWSGVSTLYGGVVAPSQHDGFSMPDVQFIKNNLSADDALTFTPFPLNTQLLIPNTTTPEYYINHTCTATGSGELVKCYQFPIALHLNNLSNVPFTVSIQAQNNGGTGTGENVISLQLLQCTGSGGTSPAPILIADTEITLNTAWTVYTLTSVFPSSSGLSLSSTEDDAWYLQVHMPLNVLCNINFTKPSLYLTDGAVPNNDFETYDVANSVFNSARTGDVRLSVNPFYNAAQKWFYGWVPMNDGTIGNATSNASTRANSDTWPLYNLLWNLASPYSASGAGTTNPICQMYNSSGTPVGYGPNISSPTTSYADFIAGNRLSLTRMMGRVLLGTVPLSALITPYTQVVSGVVSYLGNLQFTIPSNATLFVGQPVSFSSSVTSGGFPSGINGTTIYYVTKLNANSTSNTFQIASSFANALTGTTTGGSSTSYTGTLTANFQYTGTSEGEYAHTQLASEVGTHNHTGTVALSNNGASGTATPGAAFQLTTSNTALTIANNNPSGNPFNVTQPGTFYNLWIKL